MNTIIECLQKFPRIPWKDLCDQWYPGQMEKFEQARLAFASVPYPLLEKDLLEKHSSKNYREVGGLCMKILHMTGINRHIGNHAGLNATNVTQDQCDYIKKQIDSEPISWEPIKLSTFHAMNEFLGTNLTDAQVELQAQEHRILVEKNRIRMAKLDEQERIMRQAQMYGSLLPEQKKTPNNTMND
ncbi:hypothetical protein BLA29_002057 [Euroglyphus maynei]|uniref:Uncharacterized protein n=1 Tax=Euroglyphus maynei TaxID=6958 RepID=A0A1Y3BRY1_EURMA|nr:hypothetical protein BLA29_002057 [Euroglyphus maynei]